MSETGATSVPPPRRRGRRLAVSAVVVLTLLVSFVAFRYGTGEPGAVAAPASRTPAFTPPVVPPVTPSAEATDKARPKPQPKPKKPAGCGVTAIAEPTCGAWWGASLGGTELQSLERSVGRKFDLVYQWHGVDQANVPTDREIQQVEQGRFVHVNIEARRFTQPGHPAVTYADIIAGRFDAPLSAQARRFAKLDRQAFVTFDHEADAKTRYNVRGSPAQFAEAWRHIVDLYRREGADNVAFVWNVTGWKGNFDRLPGLWPGNAHVDWLSWEGYNTTGCRPNHESWRSFDDAVRPMYEWVQANGRRHGMDPGKPVMIGEMGTTPIGAHTDDWYRAVPRTLRALPRIRAVKLWHSHVGGCDYRVTTVPGVLQAFAQAGQDPYINVAH